MGISFPVFCLINDEQIDAQELGINLNLDDCVLKEYTFFSVDFVAPTRGNDNHSILSSGGSDFLINMPYHDLKQEVKNMVIFKFN